MKFICNKCNTKYSIADERVHGRVLKIRCKNCENIITIQEATAIASGSATASGAARTSPTPSGAADGGSGRPLIANAFGQASDPPRRDDSAWFVSFDGAQEGPYPLEKVRERLRGEIPRGKQAHCWREGFSSWLPAEAVPEVSEAARLAKTPARAAPARSSVQPVHSGRREPISPQASVHAPTVVKDSTRSAPKVNASSAIKSPPSAKSSSGSGLRPLPFHSAKSSSGSGSRPSPLPSAKLSNSSGPLATSGSAKSGARPVPLANATSVAMPFGAALTGGEMATQLDTGHAELQRQEPKPLIAAMPDLDAGPGSPSPNAAASSRQDDLVIEEPSGLLLPTQIDETSSSNRPPAESSGATAPASADGARPAASVVVVEAPPNGGPGWMKWALVGLCLACVGLAAVLIYVLTRPRDARPEVVTVPSITPPKLNDVPMAPTQSVPPNESRRSSTPKRAPSAKAPPQAAKESAPSTASDQLSGSQRALAAIYKDEGDRARPHDISASGRAPTAGGAVSQSAILAVVTQNHRSLNICYDRVLKHDQTLKRARVPVRVKIGTSGRVMNVSISDADYANAEIGQCLSQTIKRWTFPSSDSEYETEFPILLQAQ